MKVMDLFASTSTSTDFQDGKFISTVPIGLSDRRIDRYIHMSKAKSLVLKASEETLRHSKGLETFYRPIGHPFVITDIHVSQGPLWK